MSALSFRGEIAVDDASASSFAAAEVGDEGVDLVIFACERGGRSGA